MSPTYCQFLQDAKDLDVAFHPFTPHVKCPTLSQPIQARCKQSSRSTAMIPKRSKFFTQKTSAGSEPQTCKGKIKSRSRYSRTLLLHRRLQLTGCEARTAHCARSYFVTSLRRRYIFDRMISSQLPPSFQWAHRDHFANRWVAQQRGKTPKVNVNLEPQNRAEILSFLLKLPSWGAVAWPGGPLGAHQSQICQLIWGGPPQLDKREEI